MATRNFNVWREFCSARKWRFFVETPVSHESVTEVAARSFLRAEGAHPRREGRRIAIPDRSGEERRFQAGLAHCRFIDQDIAGGALGDDAACFEKGDVIRKMPGEIDIMSGEDKSRPHGLKLLQHGQEMRRPQLVEAGGRLVEQQNFRAHRHSSRDGGALLLAERQHMRRAVR